jgi:quercetin dioxygenase-like cupin family protein
MMHTFGQSGDLPVKELLPGFFGRMVHTDNLTVAYFDILANSVLPEHFHPHEQITNVLAGALQMTVNGETRVCRAGDYVVIPSGVPHSAVALEDCKVMDVFQPARDDYR